MLKIYNISMFCQNAVNQYVISLYFSSTRIALFLYGDRVETLRETGRFSPRNKLNIHKIQQFA